MRRGGGISCFKKLLMERWKSVLKIAFVIFFRMRPRLYHAIPGASTTNYPSVLI
jgi:hypothetical protein